jgi:hypothetical protein
VRRRAVVLVLLASLVVAGCSSGGADSYRWPEVHGYEIYEGASAEAAVDALLTSAHLAFGDEYAIETTVIYAIDDEVERDRILADHGALLQDWTAIRSGRSSVGQTWERGDQRFTVAVVTIDDQPLAVTLATRRR